MKFAKFTLSPGKNTWSLFFSIRNFLGLKGAKAIRGAKCHQIATEIEQKMMLEMDHILDPYEFRTHSGNTNVTYKLTKWKNKFHL